MVLWLNGYSRPPESQGVLCFAWENKLSPPLPPLAQTLSILNVPTNILQGCEISWRGTGATPSAGTSAFPSLPPLRPPPPPQPPGTLPSTATWRPLCVERCLRWHLLSVGWSSPRRNTTATIIHATGRNARFERGRARQSLAGPAKG